MSSNGYETPLHLELHPSRLLCTLELTGHLGAVLLLVAIELAISMRLSLTGAVLLSMGWFLWRQTRLPRRLQRDLDAVWHVEANGRVWSAVLDGDCLVHPWMTVLPLRPLGGGRRLRLVLLPDMLDAEAFRRLRVILNTDTRSKTQDPS